MATEYWVAGKTFDNKKDAIAYANSMSDYFPYRTFTIRSRQVKETNPASVVKTLRKGIKGKIQLLRGNKLLIEY
jgi:hypothetical protein